MWSQKVPRPIWMAWADALHALQEHHGQRRRPRNEWTCDMKSCSVDQSPSGRCCS
jgi:hypothetical protein